MPEVEYAGEDCRDAQHVNRIDFTYLTEQTVARGCTDKFTLHMARHRQRLLQLNVLHSLGGCG